MCGIVGYVGSRPVVDWLVRGLQALEYRGYDSAGVAFFTDSGLRIHKSEGKLSRLKEILDARADGHGHDASASEPTERKPNVGIGHTRWATHGKPTTQNAHPHKTGDVILVH